MNQRPLVVDLDETYILTDTLFEAITKLCFHSPTLIPSLIANAIKGKIALKRFLSLNIQLDMQLLPKREEVDLLIQEARTKDRNVILATATHSVYAESFSENFDRIIASNDETNMKGNEKASTLVQAFGDRGFDYIGDSKADKVVWDHSHDAILVGRAGRNPKWGAGGQNLHVIPDGRSLTKSLIRELRPHQWAKNVLVFAPLIASGLLLDIHSFVTVSLGFLAFCFVASATYVLNDLADLENDRAHKRKKTRPLAAGSLPIPMGWFAMLVLFALAVGTSLVINTWSFWVSIASYCVLTIAYSIRLKKIVLVDAIALGILYTLRIIAGAAALNMPTTFWLLTFSLLFFFSLSLMKRFSELADLAVSGGQPKIKGRGYKPDDLQLVSSLGVSSGIGATLLLALYFYFGPAAGQFKHNLALWATIPLVLLWISRAWLIAHRGEMHDDPVLFALKDKTTLAIAALVAILFGSTFLESIF